MQTSLPIRAFQYGGPRDGSFGRADEKRVPVGLHLDGKSARRNAGVEALLDAIVEEDWHLRQERRIRSIDVGKIYVRRRVSS